MTLRTFAAATLLALSLALPASAYDRATMVVSAKWLADHIKDPKLALLHVGTPDGYKEHIPGARYVRLADVSVSTEALTLEMPSAEDLRARLEALGISDDSRIVVYGGENVQSATRVIYTLQAAGFGDRVSLLDGGIAAWQREGLRLTEDVAPLPPAHLKPFKMQASIVDADTVRADLGKPGYKVIDARAPAFYDGTQTGGSKEKPHKTGHVAGAVSVPFSELTDDKMNVKPSEALAAAFAKAGVKRGDKLIVYCHIGQQATATIFAARSLGYDASLYDGSFEDWSKRDLPVETK